MMKKIIVFIYLFSSTFFSIAQQKSKELTLSELKLNVFNIMINKAIDVSYEYLQHENHSFGIGLLFKIDGKNPSQILERKGIEKNRTFSITPFYRRYFSKTYAMGFFIEGFTLFATGKIFDAISPNNPNNIDDYFVKSYTVFRPGLGIGVKMISKKGFAVDINLGIGTTIVRNLKYDIEQIARGGVSIGYRF